MFSLLFRAFCWDLRRSRIHIIAAHIAIKRLAVVLLFLLDMGEGIAHYGAAKLKNARVINGGNMLFHREGVLTEEAVVLLLRGADGGWRAVTFALGGRGRCGGHLHLIALHHLADGFQVAFLVGTKLVK